MNERLGEVDGFIRDLLYWFSVPVFDPSPAVTALASTSKLACTDLRHLLAGRVFPLSSHSILRFRTWQRLRCHMALPTLPSHASPGSAIPYAWLRNCRLSTRIKWTCQAAARNWGKPWFYTRPVTGCAWCRASFSLGMRSLRPHGTRRTSG
jgi:hypothetical protein